MYISVFIYYLTTLVPLIEYTQREGKHIIPRTFTYTYIYLFISLFFPYTKFGLYIYKLHIW
jgi:hypothetical protein